MGQQISVFGKLNQVVFTVCSEGCGDAIAAAIETVTR
jgi:hypothetical protein